MEMKEVLSLAYEEQLKNWEREYKALKEDESDPAAHAREHIERAKVDQLRKMLLMAERGDIIIKIVDKRR